MRIRSLVAVALAFALGTGVVMRAQDLAGFAFFSPSNAPRPNLFLAAVPASAAVPGGTMSNSTTGTPALAMCAAIREPIVPAPNTATLRICFIAPSALQPAKLFVDTRLACSLRPRSSLPRAKSFRRTKTNECFSIRQVKFE